MPSDSQLNVVNFPEPEDSSDKVLHQYVISTINAAVKVLNARLLCILSLLGAMTIWGVAMWDPTTLRIICGACYSALVLLPVLAMYSKKG